MRRRSPLLTTAVVLCGLATAASAATPGSTKAPLWGVAGGYTREQLKDLSRRGTSLVLLELSWSKAELGKGVWDEHYFAAARARAAFMRSLGLKVVLNLGIHNAPDWLLALPNARFVNQAGEPYLASDEPNLVFGKELRRYAEQYIQKVFEELGQNYFAVRVGGGHWGELQYPAQKSATGSWDWWAFDKNALAQSPVPRYRPCVGAPSQASTFLAWYLDQLSSFQNWQVAVVRRSYPGKIAVLYASWGMRPGDLHKAVSGNLCGISSAERNGEVQRGYDHARQIAALSDPNAVIWGTWANNPGTISYLSDLARAKALPLMGENAGGETLPQMQTTVATAKRYGLAALIWIRATDAYCYCNGYPTIDNLSTLTRQ